jgi:hypothetical protein
MDEKAADGSRVDRILIMIEQRKDYVEHSLHPQHVEIGQLTPGLFLAILATDFSSCLPCHVGMPTKRIRK